MVLRFSTTARTVGKSNQSLPLETIGVVALWKARVVVVVKKPPCRKFI